MGLFTRNTPEGYTEVAVDTSSKSRPCSLTGNTGKHEYVGCVANIGNKSHKHKLMGALWAPVKGLDTRWIVLHDIEYIYHVPPDRSARYLQHVMKDSRRSTIGSHNGDLREDSFLFSALKSCIMLAAQEFLLNLYNNPDLPGYQRSVMARAQTMFDDYIGERIIEIDHFSARFDLLDDNQMINSVKDWRFAVDVQFYAYKSYERLPSASMRMERDLEEQLKNNNSSQTEISGQQAAPRIVAPY